MLKTIDQLFSPWKCEAGACSYVHKISSGEAPLRMFLMPNGKQYCFNCLKNGDH